MLNRWQRTIVDLRGNVVPYAQLQILREQTQSAPTIYRDKAGTEAIPNAIVTANQNGYAYFYAPADLYRIRSTQPSIDWRDVAVGSGDVAIQAANRAADEADRAAGWADRSESAARRAENAEAIVDATNIQNYVAQAETARDAAFVNADVYPDVATGRAAVANGEQFQVVEGDEIVRYRRVSSR